MLEAFELAAKYSVLISDAMAVEIGEMDDTIYIEFTLKSDWAKQPQVVVRDCLNITYMSATQSVQRLTGSHHPPTLLTFSLPKPRNVFEYFRLFNCPVQFDAPVNRIGFPRSLTATPVVTSDVGLKDVLKQYADEVKSRFTGGECVASDVMREIYDNMSPDSAYVNKRSEVTQHERSLLATPAQAGGRNIQGFS